MSPPAEVPAMRSKLSRMRTPRSSSRRASTCAVNNAFTPPPSRARIWNRDGGSSASVGRYMDDRLPLGWFGVVERTIADPDWRYQTEANYSSPYRTTAGGRWRVEGLGQRLRRYREDRGWTQAVLAEQAGVSKPYLSELEGGAGRRPSGQILLKLADALGVTVADLLGRQVLPTKDPEIPPSLREFAKLRGLPESDVRMLAGIRFRGEAPRTEQRWEHI